MNDTPSSSDNDELSDNDLAVLHAFDMAEELTVHNPASTQKLPSIDPPTPSTGSLASETPENPVFPDDMLVLFVTEADGEIAAMRQALHELEQDAPADLTNSASLTTLQRSAHKLKGTAGSIGYEHISTLARYAEILARQVKIGLITNLTGSIALTHAVQALEATLYTLASEGREDSAPHTQLDLVYDALDIKLQTTDTLESIASQVPNPSTRPAPPQTQHINAPDLEQLMLHIERLAEQRIFLEHTQAQVESAQQELYTAQQRLQQLEIRLSTTPSILKTSHPAGADELPMSSLVARILNESLRRVGHAYRRKNRARPQLVRSQEAMQIQHWDELEINADTQHEYLVASLSEAIADVATASMRQRTAFEQLSRTLQKHLAQLAMVRNDALRLPHTQNAVHGLLIRVGSQRVIVPFVHVHQIDYKKNVQYDHLYSLNVLLGFPTEQIPTETAQTVLILQQDNLAVQVDEVLGEIEVLVKPLAPHLQRPGITGSATADGENVLLVLDLPELVMRTEQGQNLSIKQTPLSTRKASRTILIADDSVYIRQSVLQMLHFAGYEVMEAHDGIEALEKLLTHRVDALLLDIEMPRLNGYDLLNIIRINPLFSRLKIVMLTSRSSEKHQRYAQELGAHGYLNKPCPQDTLLTTIHSLLN